MKEILFQLDRSAPASLQAQLRESIVSGVLTRALAPGERLPSSRALANRLGISRNTVTLAYQALAADGYLTPKPRSGFVIAEDAPALPPNRDIGPTADAEAADWSHRIIDTTVGARAVDKPLNWREYEFPFIYGQADSRLFSHSEWRECARQALGAKDFGALAGDFGFHDDPLLLSYIASHSLPQRGIYKQPENILVTLGAQNALFLIAQLLIGPRTTVALEEPCYPDIGNIVRQRTKAIRSLPVDGGGLVLDEAVLEACDLVFVTPAHQCPTTATMPLERRRRLLELADKYDFLVIEDDYEFELNFLETPAPALKSMDRRGRVLYVGSFSKTLFPGLRLGYLAAPEPFVAQARHLRHLMFRHPPGHSQRTAAYFLALGHYGAQMRKLRRAYAERRRVMQAALDRYGLSRSAAAKFGGTSFWIEGPDWLDSEELAAVLAERSVLIEPGWPFYNRPAAPRNFFRIAYSSIPADRIEVGIARIAEAIGQLAP